MRTADGDCFRFEFTEEFFDFLVLDGDDLTLILCKVFLEEGEACFRRDVFDVEERNSTGCGHSRPHALEHVCLRADSLEERDFVSGDSTGDNSKCAVFCLCPGFCCLRVC